MIAPEMITNNIWLIGAGGMAIEYTRVLKAFGCQFVTIGKGKDGCENYFRETGVKPIDGGLKKYLDTKPLIPDAAIVAVGIESLSDATTTLLEYNVKYILVEKPGIGHPGEIVDLSRLAREKEATVVLAYNRRFYSSVQKARELITEDGGISSFQFEFTEWSHKIKELKKHPTELHNWFLGNSTHVIDTAFYLGGMPVELCAFTKGGLDWHPSSSIFSGAGITDKGALFSYSANWQAPGRWVIEMLTKKRRLIFRPLEKLQVQELGSVVLNDIALNDKLDVDFKPGLYMQTKAFLGQDQRNFRNIFEQEKFVKSVYLKMANYIL